ncbi:MAG: aspartyl protease-like [Polaromonas sp.]|nr:aspartyl protease-like [Polaromonas sp.]
MGMQDREGYRQAQKERARNEARANKSAPALRSAGGSTAIFIFWLAVMGLLYTGMTHYLKPKPISISASGDLVIPRARDGHFYAAGLVNGRPVSFMVDTGASLVTVSEKFAERAGIAKGVATTFKTANGEVPGRIVTGVPVALGPISVSSVRIGVGLVGGDEAEALLGQSFLSKFELLMSGQQMILRQK